MYVRNNDRFIDIIPIVEDEDITDTIRRERTDGLPAGLYIETGGAVVLEMQGGRRGVYRTVTVADGANINGDVKSVRSDGTTATGIHIFVQ